MSTQSDPNGIDQHAPGAKLDAGKVRPSLILGPMARALLAVAEVGTYGANKYSDGGWQHVPDAFKRYTDARDRHQLFEAIEPDDSESGLKHAAHAAWNALARLELILRAEAASEQCGQLEANKQAGEWIKWGGGNCPVSPYEIVDVIHRDGEIFENTRADGGNCRDWSHSDEDGDIMEYRLSPKSTAK